MGGSHQVASLCRIARCLGRDEGCPDLRHADTMIASLRHWDAAERETCVFPEGQGSHRVEQAGPSWGERG
jgi:hypothetical protein